MEVLAFIQKLGKKPTKAEWLKIYTKWDKLQTWIDAFSHQASLHWLKDNNVFSENFAYVTPMPELFDPIGDDEETEDAT